MQTATLADPRAATLDDLRPGDAVFMLATLGRSTNATLGTVIERTAGGGFSVRPEATNPVAGQNAAVSTFDAQGRYLGPIKGYRIAVELPQGARRVGSLAVAS